MGLNNTRLLFLRGEINLNFELNNGEGLGKGIFFRKLNVYFTTVDGADY